MKLKYMTIAAFSVLMMATAKESTSATISGSGLNPIISYNVDKSPYNYNRLEVKEVIKIIISDLREFEEGTEILDDALLMADLGLDSLDMLQLVIECQNFFDIDFNMADALSYSAIYTVDIFTDVIYHFCNSDADYKG